MGMWVCKVSTSNSRESSFLDGANANAQKQNHWSQGYVRLLLDRGSDLHLLKDIPTVAKSGVWKGS
jgi:hypothetical protein